MKRIYIKPACKVAETEIESDLLVASGDPYQNVNDNVDLSGGGSDSDYNGDVRARQIVGVDWDEWEE